MFSSIIRVLSILLLFLVLGNMATVEAANDEIVAKRQCATEPDLVKYLEIAALNNPELEAAFNRWKAALEKAPQVSALPDPRFTFAYFIREVETRVGPQSYRVGLMQAFPWLGKRGLMEEQALSEARVAEAQFNALRWRIRAQVKEAYLEYAYLAEAIRIAGDSVELMEYLSQVAVDRFAVGDAQYVDVVEVNLRLGILLDRHRTLQDLRRPAAARLNAVMNRPLDATLPFPDNVPLVHLESTPNELRALLLHASPELDSLEHMADAAQKAQDVARKEYYPEITLGLETIQTREARGPVIPPDSGKDAIVASISLNIPIWRERRDAAVREAGLTRIAALREHVSQANMLGAELEMLHYEYRDAARRRELYQDTLIPQARQALEVTLEAFGTGNRNAADLVTAENTLLEFELAHVRAQTDQAVRVARMENLLASEISCVDIETDEELLSWSTLP
ncbi:Outer membrane protein TolC [Desulfonatronum thiosulfatophilum]|uniref:Outer membrane protein TolC n=1 Tax=Desulfonatronum thiosulfatophilum TaxID=617002 RepID=A0A1G6AKH7_9BACT|nr:TolC family protein [Desulfonatronum thiosulfatophilum]SDB08603.1 Outer membrane protein TolC [Desulfonatronum thiosulfatophilum]